MPSRNSHPGRNQEGALTGRYFQHVLHAERLRIKPVYSVCTMFLHGIKPCTMGY
ncbi:hypothetical protein RW64_02695 [Geobacter sulfurreducens]|nr:hypothetical protein RW64_02695 [Geobacter sulfurreducens]